MLIPVYLRQVEKEVIKAKKRGKPIEKLKKNYENSITRKTDPTKTSQSQT